jgi:hypothetical protein
MAQEVEVKDGNMARGAGLEVQGPYVAVIVAGFATPQ